MYNPVNQLPKRNYSIIFCFFLTLLFNVNPLITNAQTNSNICRISCLDGRNLAAGGSVIKATIINFSMEDTIRFIIPNTFKIETSNSFITLPVSENVPSNIAIATNSTDLVYQKIVLDSVADSLEVFFRYNICNEYNNGNRNTSKLFFDCDYKGINETTFLACNLQSNIVDLLQFANQIAKFNSEFDSPIVLQHIGNLNTFGQINDEYTRIFNVRVNSLSVDSFALNIVNENDVESLSFKLKRGSNETAVSNYNYTGTDFFIKIADFDTSFYFSSTTSNLRTFTFHQKVKRICAQVNNGLITKIKAKKLNTCASNDTLFNFITNELKFNSQIATDTVEAVSNFLEIPNNVCLNSDTFYYSINVKPTQNLDSLLSVVIPINLSNFNLIDTNAVQIGHFNGNTPPTNFTTVNYTLNSSDLSNAIITINDTLIFTTTNNISNRIRIRIGLKYNCNSTTSCINENFSLTPQFNTLGFTLPGGCSNNNITQELLLPQISEQISNPATIVGGSTEFSYVTSNNPAPFYYLIGIPDVAPFTLVNNSNTFTLCDSVGYIAQLSLEGNSFDSSDTITNLYINSNLITNLLLPENGVFNIPLPQGSSGSNYIITFGLKGINCPNTTNGFGSHTFNLYLKANCLSCSDSDTNEVICNKNLACGSDILFIHCPGECDGLVGIEPGVKIKRTTYGWANEIDYPNNPIISETYFDNLTIAEKNEQLRRMYPYDKFEIKAKGSINYILQSQVFHHDSVGFKINYSEVENLPNDFFDVLDFKISFINNGDTITINNNTIAYEIESLADQQVAGLTFAMNDMTIYFKASALNNAGININTNNYTILFSGNYRINGLDGTLPGFYPVDFQCQFISKSTAANNTSVFGSCDPYGASILVLKPELILNRRTFQVFNNEYIQNNLVNQQSVGINASSNSACTFYHAVGVKFTGGLGANIDDFTNEFRPMINWPDSVFINTPPAFIENVSDLYEGPQNYLDISNGIFINNNNNTNNPLLPPIEKWQANNLFQGLLFRINRNCPNGNINTFSLNLKINKNAYVHSGFNFSEDNLTNISTIGSIQATNLGNAFNPPNNTPNINDFINLPGNFYDVLPMANGSHTFQFIIHSFGVAHGLPLIFRPVVANSSSGATLANFEFINQQPDSILQNNRFVFYNGINENDTVRFNINYPDCSDSIIEIRFNFQYFCFPHQLNSALNGSNLCYVDNPQQTNANNFRSVTRKFRRSVTNISINSITNHFSADTCSLVWNVNIPNNSLVPIDLTELQLNFITGLIYQGSDDAEIQIVCPNSPPTNISAPAPTFTYINNPDISLALMQTTISLPNIGIPFILNPGCTLKYKLPFGITTDLCSNDSVTSILTASFNYSNNCDDDDLSDTIPDGIRTVQINVNDSSLTDAFNEVASNQIADSISCCIPPPKYTIHQICSSNNLGAISIANPDSGFYAITLYGDSLIYNDTIIAQDTLVYIDSLEVGHYLLLVVNQLTGATYSNSFNIENYSFNATLENDTICEGETIMLAPSISIFNPNLLQNFTYLWSTESTDSTIFVTPNITTAYNLIIDNGYCTDTLYNTVIVNPMPNIAITANPPIIGIGQTTTISVVENNGLPIDIVWTIGNQTVSTNQMFTDTLTQTTTYVVTVTSNGCLIKDTVTIIVVDAPLACLNNPNTIIIPDGFTSSQLIDFMQTNFPTNIISPSASGQTYWEILPNNGDVLNFALIGEYHNDIELLLFRNVDFYCNSNSVILNLNLDSALAFISCNFYACGEYQWRGIENAGLLAAFGCNINNAIFAINAIEGSRNWILRNTFDNNLVGFYAELPEGSSIQFLNRENTYKNSGTLLPTFIFNNLFNWPKSICGIYLNNAGNIHIDVPNNSTSNTHFLDINCGIYSINTNLRVNNAFFENITLQNIPPFNAQIYSGCGIYQEANGTNTLTVLPAFGINNSTTFKNCDNGIRLSHTNATIKNIGFENVGIGVIGNLLADTKVIIDKNKISARRFGIHLTAIDHAQEIVANNNEIKVESNNSHSGIFMSAFHNQNNLNSNIKIQANNIKVSNGINGIQVTNIYHPKLNINKIYRNTVAPLMQSYQWAGIKSENCDNADISCNQILPGISEVQNNGGADIHISQSPNTWLAANIANGGAYKGIEFQGASNNSTVQTNVIGDHNIGLYYGTSAWVGQQPANAASNTSANRWEGTYTNTNNNAGAVNENIWMEDVNGNTILNNNAIFDNQYLVNGIQGQDPFYPENYPDNALSTNWFTYLPYPNLPPFTGGYCITSPVGNNGGGGGNGRVTNVGSYMDVAQGPVSSTQYSPETEWMLKKELLKILAIEDSLRNSNETFYFFFNNPSNANILDLLRIEENLRTANEVTAINRYLINLNDSLMSIKDSLILTNLILANDSFQQEYAMAQINNLNQEYLVLQQENKQLLNQITQLRQDSVLISELRNIALSPNNFNEYLLKQVNEIYLKSYAKGLDTLTLEDIEILENIIHICPQAGGPAVYKARALYATVNNSMVYNDSIVCRNVGYYRTIKDEIETKITEAKKEISLINNSSDNISFRLFPNPVEDKLTVKINGEIENGTLKILDALGKTIYLQQIKKNKQEIFIDASNFTDGYYMLQIATSNYIGTQKFIK